MKFLKILGLFAIVVFIAFSCLVVIQDELNHTYKNITIFDCVIVHKYGIGGSYGIDIYKTVYQIHGNENKSYDIRVSREFWDSCNVGDVRDINRNIRAKK